MADTAVFTDAVAISHYGRRAPLGPYWYSPDVGYILGIDVNEDLYYHRTANGGSTWAKTLVFTGTVGQIAAWYDQETPGDSGTLLHMVYQDDTGAAGNLYYRTLDLSDETLGTERTVSTAGNAALRQSFKISIAKARNGNLLLLRHGNNSSSDDVFRSTDAGVNWTSRANIWELTTSDDYAMVFPANTSDDADFIAIYLDMSAGAISVKMYDDSADSWTETAIRSGLTITGGWRYNMDCAVRHSDGHILVACHVNDDDTGDDVFTYDITPDSIASPSVTAKTDVYTNVAESGACGMIINQQNDDVYVAICKGGTFLTDTDVVFKKSTDGMGTWGTEQAYSETLDDYRRVQGGRSIGDDGGRIQWAFDDSDDLDVYVNLVNDVEIAAAAGGPTRPNTLAFMGVS